MSSHSFPTRRSSELLSRVNLSKGRVDKTIALLSLEAPAPIAKQGTKWQLTAATLSEAFWARAERLTALRRDEHQQMQDYAHVLERHGVSHERRTIAGEDHMSVLRSMGRVGTPMWELLVEMIARS